jgi:predicted nucleic acid-binding protein
MKGATFDAGALIALDRDDRHVAAIIARVRINGARITIPATALAQAMRNPARQSLLSRLIRHPASDVTPLSQDDAKSVGILLAKTGTADITDAHVAICARRTGTVIVTSDPDDLRRLAPDLRLVSI